MDTNDADLCAFCMDNARFVGLRVLHGDKGIDERRRNGIRLKKRGEEDMKEIGRDGVELTTNFSQQTSNLARHRQGPKSRNDRI